MGECHGSLSTKAFIRYCLARLEQEMTDKAYRIYVTDALKMIALNTAKVPGVLGGYLELRFSDVIERKQTDNRTADEIKKDVLGKLKGG